MRGLIYTGYYLCVCGGGGAIDACVAVVIGMLSKLGTEL